jgi:hypothetical protein
VKLTRTVHTSGVQVFYAPAGELLPDVQLVGSADDGTADFCLMFVDGTEAHGFLMSEQTARELAARMSSPRVEVARTIPGGMLGLNGDAP